MQMRLGYQTDAVTVYHKLLSICSVYVRFKAGALLQHAMHSTTSSNFYYRGCVRDSLASTLLSLPSSPFPPTPVDFSQTGRVYVAELTCNIKPLVVKLWMPKARLCRRTQMYESGLPQVQSVLQWSFKAVLPLT